MTKEAEMELVPRVKSVCSLQYEQYHLLHISYYIAHVAYVQVTSKSQVVIFKSQTNLESLWKTTPASQIVTTFLASHFIIWSKEVVNEDVYE